MNPQKTTIAEFLDYVQGTKFASARLINRLKDCDVYLYDRITQEKVKDIRDITDAMFIMARNAGKKTLFEFKDLRDEYLQYLSIMESETDDNAPPFYDRKQYSFWIRPDILQTLATIKNETSFIEDALLEKFEREQIPFPPAHSDLQTPRNS